MNIFFKWNEIYKYTYKKVFFYLTFPCSFFNLSQFLKQLLFIFLIQSFVWASQIKLLSPSFIGSNNLVLIMKTWYFVWWFCPISNFFYGINLDEDFINEITYQPCCVSAIASANLRLIKQVKWKPWFFGKIFILKYELPKWCRGHPFV